MTIEGDALLLKMVEQQLDAAVFENLREKVGFQPYALEDAAAALSNTLYTAEIREADRTLGMARIVGDNRLVFFIKDVVVEPEMKGKGLGRMLMGALFGYIRQHACENAYVGLMATPGTESFYEQYGFIRRPAPGLGSGMVLYITKDNADELCVQRNDGMRKSEVPT